MNADGQIIPIVEGDQGEGFTDEVDLNKAEDYSTGAPEQVAKKINEEVKKLQTQKPPSKDEIANFRVSSILKGPIRLKDEEFETYKNRRKFENKIMKIYLRGKPYEPKNITL